MEQCTQVDNIKQLKKDVEILKDLSARQTVLFEQLNKTLEKNNTVISAFNKFMIEQQTKEALMNTVKIEKKTNWRDVAMWLTLAILTITFLIDKIFLK